MKLYDRDFNFLLNEEVDLWKSLQEKEIVFINDKPSKIRRSLYPDYPKAVRHSLSLFPNNFIDTVDLRFTKENLSNILNEFKDLLELENTSERQILNFIKDRNAYFIAGSILKGNYPFGHHALYIFPELQLPPDYKVDFLLIGENSDGHHLVFIEFENPTNNITTKDGDYGNTIRKGIKQIDLWETWIEKNYSHLKLVFEKSKNVNQFLAKEFIDFDKTRMHYAVVAGRRSDYKEATYRQRRRNIDQRKLLIIHYDNLIDYSKEVIN